MNQHLNQSSPDKLQGLPNLYPMQLQVGILTYPVTEAEYRKYHNDAMSQSELSQILMRSNLNNPIKQMDKSPQVVLQTLQQSSQLSEQQVEKPKLGSRYNEG